MATTKIGRSRLLAIGAAAALAAGLIGIAGIALAEDEPGAGVTSQHEHSGDPGSCHGGPLHSVMNHLAEASGLDLETLVQAMKDGKSINTILEENGLDPATVQAEALTLLQEHLDQAVTDDEITREQADKIAARAAESLPSMMENVPPMRGGWGMKGFGGAGLETAAGTIGIDATALAEALRAGQTVADVATENGVDPQAVIDALVAEMTGRIDQAVADGQITAERAEEMKASAVDRITTFVNEARPQPGSMGRHGRMR